jgi:hypothetical protein
MVNCAEMKIGEVYVCDGCGLELKVVKECSCEEEDQGCGCPPLVCCGKPLRSKRR